MLKQFENVDEKRDGKLQKRDGKLQQTRDEILGRPVTNQYVEKESFEYNMNHPRRGKCLVFYFSTFHPRVKLENRRCAEEDKNNIKRSFGHLGFEVEEHHNFSRDNVLQTIQKVSEEDHSDCDCLALVFMSHGTFDENTKEQWLWTFDDKIYPQDLWKNFTGSKCLSLAGKPKLFFIQACRGPETDRGVAVTKAMRVVTDGVVVRPLEKRYTLPSHADMLIMWASFPGHFAFKSNNGGIRGSVFIHFLSKVFAEEGTKESLASLLLLVTRNVALEFESFNPYVERIDSNKQIPMTESTLLRHTYFIPKTDVKML